MLVRRLSLLLGLWVVGASQIHAQSAEEILTNMLDEFERRAQGVDNYTLIQEAMGFQTMSYFEKEVVNGRATFVLRQSGAAGMTVDQSPGDAGMAQMFAAGEELFERTRYLGTERIDGYDLHILEITDFEGLDFGKTMTPDSEFTPTAGRVYLDADTYAPRRLEFDGEMINDQGTNPIQSVVEMQDYREVESLLLPFRTVVTVNGIGAAIDDETRKEFERMREELEKLPPAQREMLESMMSEQMAQVESLMSGDGGPMVMQVLVTEVKVNQGPPSL